MKALLLAAGLGTRLQPITDNCPKCLVPIDGKPLLEYWLDNLSDVGVTEFIINTHYLSEQVEVFAENSKYSKNITLVSEKDLLLTAGTILKNKTLLDGESFMVVHADNLSFCDFGKFIESHKKRPPHCEMTMMLFKSDNPSSCGIVELDQNNVVQQFHEKVKEPPSDLANGAVYIFEPTLFEHLESFQRKEIDLSIDVLPNYMGKISTFLNDVYHRDIGTIQSYALAQIEIRSITRKIS